MTEASRDAPPRIQVLLQDGRPGAVCVLKPLFDPAGLVLEHLPDGATPAGTAAWTASLSPLPPGTMEIQLAALPELAFTTGDGTPAVRILLPEGRDAWSVAMPGCTVEDAAVRVRRDLPWPGQVEACDWLGDPWVQILAWRQDERGHLDLTVCGRPRARMGRVTRGALRLVVRQPGGGRVVRVQGLGCYFHP